MQAKIVALSTDKFRFRGIETVKELPKLVARYMCGNAVSEKFATRIADVTWKDSNWVGPYFPVIHSSFIL